VTTQPGIVGKFYSNEGNVGNLAKCGVISGGSAVTG